MNKDYRVISGVAYPYLIAGKNKTDSITANVADRNAYYYDEAIRLSESDIINMKNLVGHPLCVEHQENIDVGHITHSWTDAEGQLRFMARLNLKEQAGRMADAAMRRGELKGISVGYSPDIDFETMKVRGKVFKEISLCKRGFFPGARVSVHASDELTPEKYKSNSNTMIYYKISAMEGEKTDIPKEPVQQQVEQESNNEEQDKDAVELARQTDEMLKKNELLQNKLKEQDSKLARLAELERKEQERQAKYEEEKALELEKVLEIQKQQFKDVHGEDAELPQAYQESAKMAFKYEEAAPQMQAITASAFAYQRQKDQNAELAKRLADMETRMKKLTDVNKVAMSHVAATHRRVFDDEKEENTEDKDKPILDPEVKASGSGFSMLFVPNASNEEIQLFQRDYGHLQAPGVQASDKDAATFEAPPVHAHIEHVGNSMRHKFPHIFTHLVKFDPKNEPIITMKGQYERM